MLDTLKAKDQQVCADYIHEGVVKLTAAEMHRVLQECAYEHQRNVSERHVAVLTDLMKRDKWQPKSQLDFALLNGRLILVNGYHRGFAQVASGKAISWAVAIHPAKTEADLRSLYFAFDTNVRARSSRDILNAYEFAETAGLPSEMADALYRAVPFIASRFQTAPDKRDNLSAKAVDRRLAIAADYAKAAARYAACLEGMTGTRKKKFYSAGLTAVAVITFRYQSETAWQFWSGVAQNDGLKRGDARHALVSDLMTRVNKNGWSAYSFGPAIIAWNAFFNDRQLQMIKVYPETFLPVIDGTPFDGKPVKA